MNESAMTAIILLAHGARDSRWGEPFLRVADRVRRAAPDVPVEVAYLEHLHPGLVEAARRLASRGTKSIRVVPIFFGRGGHLRVEVPRLVAEAMGALPGVAIDITLPAGDDDAVQDAVASFCLRAARGG
jgi:sirohydrochlorin cobaltochelatase